MFARRDFIRDYMMRPPGTGEARVVGLFRMKDKGLNDNKILGVPHKDPLFEHIRRLEDVPSHFLREVEFFFATTNSWKV